VSFSTYFENEILDHLCLKGDYIAGYMYLGLWIGNPTDSGGGGAEVSGGAYTRQVMTGVHWGTAAAGVILNNLIVTFAEATANWGDVTHFVLMDALTGGNMLISGTLIGAPISIVTGSIPRFAIGTLVITLD